MPDWKPFKDSDGNLYYFDTTGKVRTLGSPVVRYKPVSAEGIEYYINHAQDLVKNRFRVDALIMLKAIIAMPASDQSVYKAQVKASRLINEMARKEGSRYPDLAFQSSLFFYRYKNEITVINDYMGYSIKIKGNVDFIRKKDRKEEKYAYQGVVLGLLLKEGAKSQDGYDALLAIDAEKYSFAVKSIDMLKNHWDFIAGVDEISRKEISKTETGVIYQYNPQNSKDPAGFEGVMGSGKNGYFVKIIAPESRFGALKDTLLQVMKSFTFVKNQK